MKNFILDNSYQNLLTDIKQRYQSAQLKAAYSVNKEMIRFYWQLGTTILEQQANANWGTKFLEQLSYDLRRDFPGTTGFSVRNLERMRKFSILFPNLIPAQVVPELEEHPIIQLP